MDVNDDYTKRVNAAFSVLLNCAEPFDFTLVFIVISHGVWCSSTNIREVVLGNDGLLFIKQHVRRVLLESSHVTFLGSQFTHV